MIRKLLSLMAVGLLAATAAHAGPTTYYVSLSGSAESPTNASPGTGFATVTIDPLAHTLAVDVTFSGLLGVTTASHIHIINGPGDTNTLDTVGPVATQTPAFLGFPLGVTAGTYNSPTFDTSLASTYRAGWITDSGGLAAAEAAFFAGITDGRAYLNIHTTVVPGGEIRGFLQTVPEPGTLALLGLGLAGFAAVRSRKR